jgi:hypothetical protein
MVAPLSIFDARPKDLGGTGPCINSEESRTRSETENEERVGEMRDKKQCQAHNNIPTRDDHIFKGQSKHDGWSDRIWH